MNNPPSTLRLALILGALSAAGPLSIDMYLPGLPLIATELGATTAEIQATLTIYLLGLAFGQLIYGPLSDRYGRRGPLLFGWALYALASLGCALAPDGTMLTWMRLLQALGGCTGAVITRSIVRDCYSGAEVARMFSLLLLVMGVAPIVAPLIGGQMIAWLGWRSIFWFLALFGALCVAMVYFGLPETLAAERRSHANPLAVLSGYGSLFADRIFIGATLSGGLVSAAMFSYITAAPFVLIEFYGLSSGQFSLIFGLNAAGLIAASQLNRAILRRTSSLAVMTWTVPVLVVCASLLMATALSGFGGLLGLLVPLFFCISGYGFIVPNASAIAIEHHAAHAGRAAALMGGLQFLIGALMGTLVGWLGEGAIAMAAVILACDLVACLIFWLAVVRLPQAVAETTA